MTQPLAAPSGRRRAARARARRPTSASSRPRRSGSRGCATGWPSASRAAGGWSRSARSPAARSDVRHVAVEFVHPVIVGKRALPALGLSREGGPLAAQVELLAEPDDIVIAFGAASRDARRARARARARLPDDRLRAGGRRVGVRAARATTRSCARSWSRRSTTCCGSSCTCSSSTAACSRGARRAPCTTPARRASSTRSSPSARPTSTRCSPTCARSVLMKAAEVGELRAQTLTEDRATLLAAAAARCARASTRGGKLLALGNGGSATDAMDARRRPPRRAAGLAGAARARPHRGPGDPHRDRQRHRRRGDLRAPGDRLRRAPGDALLALSTSGSSRERDRGAGRGAPARAASRSRSSATTAAGSPPRGSPTTWSSRARSTSRASRRRRRAPTTCCASWSSCA